MKRLLAVGAVLLLLTGCAGQTQAPAPASTDRVEMPKSYRFDPAEINVKAGTTVTWHNGDNFTHSVKFVQGIDTVLVLAPGQSGQITFTTPGEYDYYCTFHTQQMTGKVVVSGP